MMIASSVVFGLVAVLAASPFKSMLPNRSEERDKQASEVAAVDVGTALSDVRRGAPADPVVVESGGGAGGRTTAAPPLRCVVADEENGCRCCCDGRDCCGCCCCG